MRSSGEERGLDLFLLLTNLLLAGPGLPDADPPFAGDPDRDLLAEDDIAVAPAPILPDRR